MHHADAPADRSKEIADLNLNYLLLAQRLLVEDRTAAMLRLGISAELADFLLGMTVAQLVRLATSNFVLCSFRADDLPLRALLEPERKSALQQAHLSIMLAARDGSAGPVPVAA